MRTLLTAVAALFVLAISAHGQFADAAAPPAWTAPAGAAAAPHPPTLPAPEAWAGGGRLSWFEWGLVGAAGGALLVSGLHGMGGGTPTTSRGSAALMGGATGFVVVGGGVAFYQWVCGSDSWSRRNSLCGR